jgi:hypothetical protein
VNRLRNFAVAGHTPAAFESEPPGVVTGGVTLTVIVAFAVGALFLTLNRPPEHQSTFNSDPPSVFARTAIDALGPALEAERLRTLELAAIDSICAQARRAGDAIGPICGLPSERPPRAQATAPARPRANEAPPSRWTPPTLWWRYPYDDQILLAPPGFGPDPNDPLKK